LAHVASLLPDAGGGERGVVLCPQLVVADHDPRAALGQEQGRGPADAAGAAGDDGHSAAEVASRVQRYSSRSILLSPRCTLPLYFALQLALGVVLGGPALWNRPFRRSNVGLAAGR